MTSLFIKAPSSMMKWGIKKELDWNRGTDIIDTFKNQ